MWNDEHDSPENPYAAPESGALGSEEVTVESGTNRDLWVFVGTRADYYLRKWVPALEGRAGSVGFNWAAFFLTALWIPYRKMYLVATILYAIMLVETIFEEVLFVGILGREEAPAVLSNLVGLAVAFICGANGNRWYLSHARKVISEVRSRGVDESEVFGMLSERGGTSVGASLGFLALFLLGILLVLFLSELLLYEW